MPKIKSSDAAKVEKKAWETPHIESFAVAGITEGGANGGVDDGINLNAPNS